MNQLKNNHPKHQAALIYCRVSTLRQVTENFGLESQEKMCLERCERNNISIFKIIKDK